MARGKQQHPISTTQKDKVAVGKVLRKKRRFHPGTVALRQIRKYQTSAELVIPKKPINSLIREILLNPNNPTTTSKQATMITRGAAEALHHAAENFLTDVFSTGQALAIKIGKSRTLRRRDFQFAASIVAHGKVPSLGALASIDPYVLKENKPVLAPEVLAVNSGVFGESVETKVETDSDSDSI